VTLEFEAVVIDCSDTELVGGFWSELLRLPLVGPDRDGNRFIAAYHTTPELIFVPVPEGKSVKNRVHVDLRPDDQAAEVERAVSLGAKRVDIGQRDVTWVVLADPEGNEFCILRARRPQET
jgi:hypothetical protein